MTVEFNLQGNRRGAIAALAMTLLGVSVSAAAGVPANITAAVADNARPDEDKQRDANRKPGETLAFADVRAGELIGELTPGGGYFSRILSKAVGPKGHVFAIVPPRSPINFWCSAATR